MSYKNVYAENIFHHLKYYVKRKRCSGERKWFKTKSKEKLFFFFGFVRFSLADRQKYVNGSF